MDIETLFTRSWYGKSGWTNVFRPLQPLVKKTVLQKRKAFLKHPEMSYKAPVPVIVVGNISVGGTGKSPMVIALCGLLKEQGYLPGIVSRGHGAKLTEPTLVFADSLASEVGDEPVMLVNRTDCPMVVYPKRDEAVKHLLATSNVNVVISDDGMQHYRLNRDIEIAMLDSQRGVGNGQLLPVGPLREPVDRLLDVDFVVSVSETMTSSLIELELPITLTQLSTDTLISLDGTQQQSCQQAFSSDRQWHVMAGIGNPQRFLDTLFKLGLRQDTSFKWFADHHSFIASDIPREGAVIVTEKDAVKLRKLNLKNTNIWYLPVSLKLPNDFQEALILKLKQI